MTILGIRPQNQYHSSSTVISSHTLVQVSLGNLKCPADSGYYFSVTEWKDQAKTPKDETSILSFIANTWSNSIEIYVQIRHTKSLQHCISIPSCPVVLLPSSWSRDPQKGETKFTFQHIWVHEAINHAGKTLLCCVPKRPNSYPGDLHTLPGENSWDELSGAIMWHPLFVSISVLSGNVIALLVGQ